MSVKPLVSVLIPAYNAERWIHQTLRSAIAQDYARTEVILVNDGSRDRTLEIARTFESKSVKIIDQDNAGGAAARNTALAHAQGEYFQWLDHDDILAVDKVSTQMRHVERLQDRRLLLSGAFGTFHFDTRRSRFEQGPLWRSLAPIEYFYVKFEKDTWIHTTCWLVSRELTDAAGPWLDLRSPDDDGEYFCRVVAASDGIEFVPEARSFWRVGNTSSFSFNRASSAKTLEAFLVSTLLCIDHFLGMEETDRSRAACVSLLRNRLIYFYPRHTELLERIYASAEKLGGKLAKPPLLPHYEALASLTGWSFAHRMQGLLPSLKGTLGRKWEQMLFDVHGADNSIH